VLPAGLLAPHVALQAAVTLAGLALGAALALALCLPALPLVLPLAAAIVALSWSYSAPPARLCGRGLGELTTAVVVTLLTPLYGFYLQAGALDRVLLLAVLPLCGLQFGMLLAIELPDATGDAHAGKRTLVVRRGAAFGARLYTAVVLGSFLGLPLLAWAGLPARVAIAAAVLAPVAAWLAFRMSRGDYRDGDRWEGLAFGSVALLIGTAAAELVAMATLTHSP
jgi:1,4-dihydroxy-2-naphthoate octaprenyltransferase